MIINFISIICCQVRNHQIFLIETLISEQLISKILPINLILIVASSMPLLIHHSDLRPEHQISMSMLPCSALKGQKVQKHFGH
jgi:hypothetical protein